ncbi:MAG: hypothetical protein KDD60_10750, partial [Bdellovibrionales bacterium]|nr:hypothetical protein [Bdellovibrionales bacterium]
MAAVHSVVRSVNEFGHLDGELGSNYSSSEVRKLVILGDSSVQGLTPPRFTFPEQLRDQLGSYFSDRNLEYDVLNLGVPGYSPKIVLLQLRQLLAESRPDLVIVAFDMRTDFENWKYSHSEQRDSEGGLTAVSPLSPSEIGFFEDVDGVHPYQWIFEFARTVRERSAFARWISRF